ncbi:MAG: PD-(D/E)XK nuclease family protein [Treponema sp.]|nr:PD-(D/E)XK nuclease family protein [Treponema sp.]
MSDKPNIFDYATSELSQDAFFAWLLRWAEDGLEREDKYLHDCALNLLKVFFEEYYNDYHSSLGASFLKDIQKFKFVNSIKFVDVNCQKKRIDLWLTIETYKETYYLVIEDKIHSTQHDNQLKTYRSYFSEDEKKRTCFVYLKTGKLIKGEKKVIKEEKYSLFDLNSVYNVLKECQSKNEIFCSYFSKLEAVYFLRKFIEEVNFNDLFKKSYYKHGIWKNNCYWFYKKRKLSCRKCSKYYLALDVWLNEKTIDFYLHIISNLKGTWIADSDIINIEDVIEKNKVYGYELNDNYYEKKVPFENQENLNSLIKKEIKNLFSGE